MRDFSIAIYKSLLDTLKEAGFQFQTFSGFLESPVSRVVMLRHDVDDRKLHSLEFARIQHDRGIRGTYYFRMVPQSFDEGVIREIYEMGHEIGYHYEEMDFAKGDPVLAIRLFEQNLKRLRQVVPVTSICMHGSPMSKYDNKDIWRQYDYRHYGLIGEPYFDLDFDKVFYLTDTGRRWDGDKVSVRDKVDANFSLSFHATQQIIDCIRKRTFPETVMFNFHPQRWTDDRLLWWREKYTQQFKNQAKYFLVRWRNIRSGKTTTDPLISRG